MRVIVHLVPALPHGTCNASPECYNAVLTVRYLLVAQPCQWLTDTVLKQL